jgi:hypothetical protein
LSDCSGRRHAFPDDESLRIVKGSGLEISISGHQERREPWTDVVQTRRKYWKGGERVWNQLCPSCPSRMKIRKGCRTNPSPFLSPVYEKINKCQQEGGIEGRRKSIGTNVRRPESARRSRHARLAGGRRRLGSRSGDLASWRRRLWCSRGRRNDDFLDDRRRDDDGSGARRRLNGTRSSRARGGRHNSDGSLRDDGRGKRVLGGDGGEDVLHTGGDEGGRGDGGDGGSGGGDRRGLLLVGMEEHMVRLRGTTD